jgi:hypothetical protein
LSCCADHLIDKTQAALPAAVAGKIAPDPAMEISVTTVGSLRRNLGHRQRDAERSAREAQENPVDVPCGPAERVVAKLAQVERRRFRNCGI